MSIKPILKSIQAHEASVNQTEQLLNKALKKKSKDALQKGTLTQEQLRATNDAIPNLKSSLDALKKTAKKGSELLKQIKKAETELKSLQDHAAKLDPKWQEVSLLNSAPAASDLPPPNFGTPSSTSTSTSSSAPIPPPITPTSSKADKVGSTKINAKEELKAKKALVEKELAAYNALLDTYFTATNKALKSGDKNDIRAAATLSQTQQNYITAFDALQDSIKELKKLEKTAKKTDKTIHETLNQLEKKTDELLSVQVKMATRSFKGVKKDPKPTAAFDKNGKTWKIKQKRREKNRP